jgi:hypothetical protein
VDPSGESFQTAGITLSPSDWLAARARLQWTRERLALEAGIDVAQIISFELEQSPAPRNVIATLTGALEAAQNVSPFFTDPGSTSL